MYRYQAVIFDLDGTLLDTLEDLKDSVNAALFAYGCKERSLEEVRNFVGNGIRNLMLQAVEGGNAHPEFENIFQYFKDDYKKNCKNKTKPYSGIMDVLKQLKRDGVKLAMVSNKADFAVKELNLYYFKDLDMIAAGEKEGVRRKPAPDAVFQGQAVRIQGPPAPFPVSARPPRTGSHSRTHGAHEYGAWPRPDGAPSQ